MNTKQITDLILLVGTNPLPNYVTADYMLQTSPHLARVWWIYSDQTKKIKDNIERLIQQKYSHRELEWLNIGLSEVENPDKIREEIQSGITSSGEFIHLNYTGGTKAMVAAAYSFFKGKNASLSYLSAQKFCLIFDNGTQSERLIEKVQLSFEELIALHGYIQCGQIHDQVLNSTHLEAVKYMRKLIEQDKYADLKSKQGGYDKENLFSTKTKSKSLASLPQSREHVSGKKPKEKALSEQSWENLVTKRFKANTTFKNLANLFGGPLFLEDGSFNTDVQAEVFSDAIKFIDGTWLEEYVYQCLSAESDLYDEMLHSKEIRQPEWPPELKFELDVLLLKGYQLTGISCTTDKNKSPCKQKAFEIIHRVRQIGGDEAKPILICALPNAGTPNVKDDATKEALQKEMDIETGGKKNILILGINDWKPQRLIQEIRKYLGAE